MGGLSLALPTRGQSMSRRECILCGKIGGYDFEGDCVCDECIARTDEAVPAAIDVAGLQIILTETQARADQLSRDLTEARTEKRQVVQRIEELEETVRHYQQAARGMGPVHSVAGALVGGEWVTIP